MSDKNNFENKINDLETGQLRKEHVSLMNEQLQQRSSSHGILGIIKSLFIVKDSVSGRTEINKARTSVLIVFVSVVLFVLLSVLSSSHRINVSSTVYSKTKPMPSFNTIEKTPSMIDTIEKKAHDPLPDNTYDAEKYLKQYSPSSINSETRSPVISDKLYSPIISKPSKPTPTSKPKPSTIVSDEDASEDNNNDLSPAPSVDNTNNNSEPVYKAPEVIFNNKNYLKYLKKNKPEEDNKPSDSNINNITTNQSNSKNDSSPNQPNAKKDNSSFSFTPMSGEKILVTLEYDVFTNIDRVIIAIPSDPRYTFPANSRFYGKYYGAYKDNIVLYFTAYSINGVSYPINSVAAQDDTTSIKADKLDSVDVGESVTTGALRASRGILPSSGTLIDNFLNAAGSSILSGINTSKNYLDVYRIEKGSTFYLVILP